MEKTDAFGHLVSKSDYGGHSYAYSYDRAGHLVHRSNSLGENPSYSYYNTGQLAQEIDTQGDPANYNGKITTSSFAYDANGNRVFEGMTATTYYMNQDVDWGSSYYDDWEQQWHYVYYNIPAVSTTTVQNSAVSYDALNRMTILTDGGYGGAAPVTLTWSYDLNGNIRNRHSTYRAMDANGTIAGTNSVEDDWYKYDSMNRVVTTKGDLVGGQITRGTKGMDILYDKAGERTAVMTTGEYYNWDEYGWSDDWDMVYETRETYSYTADGYLAQVNSAAGEAVAAGSLSPGQAPPVASSGSVIAGVRAWYRASALTRRRRL